HSITVSPSLGMYTPRQPTIVKIVPDYETFCIFFMRKDQAFSKEKRPEMSQMDYVASDLARMRKIN
ncbi:hypothetical protein, partial [Leptospira kanakyensis]|uniref:hypothetical protein n=1 Tax=Leptospira kanakyensis TaxID=2484968 RepID=UPI001ABF0F6B